MNRFASYDIKKRPFVSALFTYPDSYIDGGLRLYNLRQSLHLYLKSQGFETVIFYDVNGGHQSFEQKCSNGSSCPKRRKPRRQGSSPRWSIP